MLILSAQVQSTCAQKAYVKVFLFFRLDFQYSFSFLVVPIIIINKEIQLIANFFIRHIGG